MTITLAFNHLSHYFYADGSGLSLFPPDRPAIAEMTDKLPPQLLALFQPRPAVRYVPPLDSSPEEKGTKKSQITGLAAFLPQIDDYKENDDYEPTESWLQARDRKRLENQQRIVDMQKDDFDGFKPDEDPKIRGEALKTLFVGRLSFDAKEVDLEKEFSRFGPIERIRIVRDEVSAKAKKAHRGYAFIVYERERDMKGNISPLKSPDNGKMSLY